MDNTDFWDGELGKFLALLEITKYSETNQCHKVGSQLG